MWLKLPDTVLKLKQVSLFSVRRISYLIKIVQDSKYLTDLLDGPNLSDAWNVPDLAIMIHFSKRQGELREGQGVKKAG